LLGSTSLRGADDVLAEEVDHRDGCGRKEDLAIGVGQRDAADDAVVVALCVDPERRLIAERAEVVQGERLADRTAGLGRWLVEELRTRRCPRRPPSGGCPEVRRTSAAARCDQAALTVSF
jgi:hypothetical protein